MNSILFECKIINPSGKVQRVVTEKENRKRHWSQFQENNGQWESFRNFDMERESSCPKTTKGFTVEF